MKSPQAPVLPDHAPLRTASVHVETLGELLAHAAACGVGGLRFVDRDETAELVGWREFHERARTAAAGLTELGVRPGDRVGLVFPTGPGFFDAFFGAVLAGAVPVPLYPPVRLGRLAEYHRRTAGMLAAAGARLVLADARVRRLLGETLERTAPVLGCRTVGELPRGDAGGLAPPAARPGDLAMVQFSSGTTVDPKPVALSHRAVLAQTRVLDGCWPALLGAERPTGVSWLPLYHDMGLIGCIFPAMDLPSTVTLISPEAFVARPALWLRAISHYRAEISPAPNFAYGLAVHKVRDEEMQGVDLSCWRVALNGAEPVAPVVLRAFCDRFARWGFRPEALTPVYGLSEAALAVTFSDLDRPFTAARFERAALSERGEARPIGARATRGGADGGAGAEAGGDGGDGAAGIAGIDAAGGAGATAEAGRDGVELVSVGRPLPGFEVRVLPDPGDEDDLPPSPAGTARLPEGEVGRVWVRGPSLMEGYLGRPEATARVLRDGWLDTGDLGFLHGGELFLTGRAKDVVILRGRNHAPEEIEHAVWEVPGVRRGCVVAASWLPEDAESEQLVLLVERDLGAGDRAALPGEIAAGCARAVLAATGLSPDRVEVLEPGTLPRTSSGKLRRREALGRWLAGELVPPDPVTPLRLAAAFARSGLAHARRRLRGHGLGGGEEPQEA